MRHKGSLIGDRRMPRKDGTSFYAFSVVTTIHSETG